VVLVAVLSSLAQAWLLAWAQGSSESAARRSCPGPWGGGPVRNG